jgi:nitrite reductase/ring-hydroxylating ferredoxin subunit
VRTLVPLVPLDHLAPGRAEVREHVGVPYLVVRTDETVYVLQGRCTHAKSLLGPARLAGDLVECPMHGALFSPVDGSVKKGPALVGLNHFDCEVRGGVVYFDPSRPHAAPEAPEQPSSPWNAWTAVDQRLERTEE